MTHLGYSTHQRCCSVCFNGLTNVILSQDRDLARSLSVATEVSGSLKKHVKEPPKPPRQNVSSLLRATMGVNDGVPSPKPKSRTERKSHFEDVGTASESEPEKKMSLLLGEGCTSDFESSEESESGYEDMEEDEVGQADLEISQYIPAHMTEEDEPQRCFGGFPLC